MVILKTYEIMVDSTWGFNWVALIPVIFGLILLVFGIEWLIQQRDPIGIALILVSVLFVLMGVTIFAKATPIYETWHDIYVEENTPLQEVIDKYDIIEVDGLTLTVRDKAPD